MFIIVIVTFFFCFFFVCLFFVFFCFVFCVCVGGGGRRVCVCVGGGHCLFFMPTSLWCLGKAVLSNFRFSS